MMFAATGTEELTQPVNIQQAMLGPWGFMIIGGILAFVAGIFLGYFWRHASVENKTIFGTKGVIALATTIGTGVLSAWSVEYAGPLHGIAWFLGVLLGNLIATRRLIRAYAKEAYALPSEQQEVFSAFVERNLFIEGHSRLEKQIPVRLRKLRENRSRQLFAAVEELHAFIHAARDEALHYFRTHEKLLLEATQTRDFSAYSEAMTHEFDRYVQTNLQRIVRIFDVLLGQQGSTWAAVRQLIVVDNNRVYRTIHRAGKFKENRANQSEDIPEDNGLPSALRTAYEKGNGILRLGATRKNSVWQRTENDERGEDKNLMAGPVIIKSWDSKTEDVRNEIYLILYINSPKPAAFDEMDEPFLKCCTDVFSLFFSMAMDRILADSI